MDCKYINFSDNTGYPFSDMVEVNGMLYLSGLISEDFDTGELVRGTVAEETRHIFKNLKWLLESAGSDLDHVVRVEVLLSDFSERDEMNEEYKKHFKPDHMPARLCYGGVDLAANCKIEIQVTAVKK